MTTGQFLVEVSYITFLIEVQLSDLFAVDVKKNQKRNEKKKLTIWYLEQIAWANFRLCKTLHWGWFVEVENTIVHEKNSAHFDHPPPFFLNSQLVSPRSNSLQIEVFLWAVNPSLRCRATKEEGSGVLASPRPFFNCDYYFFLSQQLTSLTIQLIEECESP